MFAAFIYLKLILFCLITYLRTVEFIKSTIHNLKLRVELFK